MTEQFSIHVYPCDQRMTLQYRSLEQTNDAVQIFFLTNISARKTYPIYPLYAAAVANLFIVI